MRDAVVRAIAARSGAPESVTIALRAIPRGEGSLGVGRLGIDATAEYDRRVTVLFDLGLLGGCH